MNNIRFYCCLSVWLPTFCLAGVAEVIQQPAGQSLVLAGPDESILWSLFHAGKIDTVKRQIADLRQRYPGWQVPADLQTALNPSGGKAVVTAKPGRKTSHAAKRPIDGCANIDRKWAYAEAQWARGYGHSSAKLYAGIIEGCKNPDLVKATLEKAANLTDRDDYFNLIELTGDVLPEAGLQRLKYQWLKNAYLHQPKKGSEVRLADEKEIQLSAERFQDAGLASVMAWGYFDQQNYRDAYVWFNKAGQWDPTGNDALQGKMLSLEKLGDYDAALAIYPVGSADAKLNEIAGRLYKIKAWQDIKSSQPQRAEQNLIKARSVVGVEDPETQKIEAWIADSRKEYAKAAALFDSLYRRSPGTEYARAYVRNQSRIDSDSLARNAEQSGGLLLEEYRLYRGRELYYRKQFLAAHKIASTQFPMLANIDAPSARLGAYARHKTGGPGLEQGFSELNILKMPVAGGSYTVGGIHNFQLSLSRVALSSGSLGAFAGHGITDQLSNGLETDFLYRMDGWLSPYVRLGHTPTGGVIAPTITFDAGFVQQTHSGNWSLNAYSQSVRQSLLSYTGLGDPEGQLNAPNDPRRKWGRVMRTGLQAAGYYRFNQDWGMAASAEVAMLNGVNVADNKTFGGSFSPGRNIVVPGFDYFTIGPSVAYQHYQKNLSHFTLGQGGYFSPEHYINSGFGVQFLSQEGKPLVFRGHVTAGMQFTDLANSPKYPMSISSEIYQDHKGFGLGDALDIELKGVWLLAPNLQVGAGAAVRHTANYEDYTGGLFIRMLFKDRKASYSSDIPDAMFNGIQRY